MKNIDYKNYLKIILLIFLLLFAFYHKYTVRAETIDELDFENVGGYPVPEQGNAAWSQYNTIGNWIHSKDVGQGDTEYGSLANYYKTDFGMYYALRLNYFKVYEKGTGVSIRINDYQECWSQQGKCWTQNNFYEGVIYLTNFDQKKFKWGEPYKSTAWTSNVGPYIYYYGSGAFSSQIHDYYVNYINYKGFMVTALHFKIQLKNLQTDAILHFNVGTDDFPVGTELKPYVVGYHIQSSGTNEDMLDHTNENKVLDDINQDNDYDRDHFHGAVEVPVVECNGVIDCAIKDVLSAIKKWFNGIFKFWIDLLKPLFVPNSNIITSLGTDFLTWFDKKLGFLSFPLTFSIDYLNRIANIKDTGSYVIKVPEIKFPGQNIAFIKEMSFDFGTILKDDTLKKYHKIYLMVVNGVLSFAFLNLCYTKYNEVFGGNGSNSVNDKGYGRKDDES